MLVEELDVAVVDTLGDFLTNLMRRPALDHIETCPSVLGLSTRGSTDKEVVLQLALEVVLLDMVGQSSGDFPIIVLVSVTLSSRLQRSSISHNISKP
jgi:hypothetical protein